MEKDYKELLRLALEIEGLLSLLEHGEASVPERVEALLSEKTAELASAFDVNRVTEPTETVEAETEVEPEVAETEVYTEPESTETEVVTDVTAEVNEAAEDNAPEDDDAADGDPFDVGEEEVNKAENAGMKLDEKLAIDTSRDIRRAFTLNDRFRFRRELFENSEARFSEALDVISGMSSYEEAEEYFYDDLCLEADNDDVKDFMQRVYNHFR